MKVSAIVPVLNEKLTAGVVRLARPAGASVILGTNRGEVMSMYVSPAIVSVAVSNPQQSTTELA
jgi:hypothetical protein